MGIPESQLESWSKIGSITQSAATNQSIRAVLDNASAPFSGRDCISFLQGSYANQTNIIGRESDVDIILRSAATFYYDTELVPDSETSLVEGTMTPATYDFATFKSEVFQWLMSNFNSSVVMGNKAISIKGNGSRRDADVIPSFQYRRYTSKNSFIEGICFFANDGTKIINYPKQHSENSTWKHQSTNGYYKPLVRILKNMRNRCIDEKILGDGVAPSYFIEGLLYNAPNKLFAGSYADALVATVDWLDTADRSKFVCANDQYVLLHPYSPVTWRAEHCEAFIRAICTLWNDWRHV